MRCVTQPYAVDKVAHHAEAFARIGRREHQAPVVVHFMPMLACNQACHFCAFGHRIAGDPEDQQGWKNMELMSNEFLPLGKTRELVADWRSMGVKAIELTGGGEPLIWPHADEFLGLASEWGVDMALVTNGTALTEKRAALFGATAWKWARVSIDAGCVEDYTATRRVPAKHWELAWAAVRRLVAMRQVGSEQRVGVGFVVDRSNYLGVYTFCALAKAAGADNVRIGMAFTPAGLARITPEARVSVQQQIAEASRSFECDTFKINALFGERCQNLASRAQDYEFCGVKEVLCVVGGDQRVYSCCSLAFNSAGLIGSIADQSFAAMWNSDETLRWFGGHDAREQCRVECLYETRNKRILTMLADPAEAERVRALPVVHRNYL
jgi:wyosine [tRNA(Phe)-imidazoG37] synthetase (radical SAM superfamily)